jgi:hypothetical protein
MIARVLPGVFATADHKFVNRKKPFTRKVPILRAAFESRNKYDPRTANRPKEALKAERRKKQA